MSEAELHVLQRRLQRRDPQQGAPRRAALPSADRLRLRRARACRPGSGQAGPGERAAALSTPSSEPARRTRRSSTSDQQPAVPHERERRPEKGELTWVPLSIGSRRMHSAQPLVRGRVRVWSRALAQAARWARAATSAEPPSEWLALIRDAHPGYISWDEYARNRATTSASAKALHFDDRRQPPREGPALLQGRAVCGLCGSRMHVRYSHRRGGQLCPNYVCVGRGRLFADPLCQSIMGTAIDAAIGRLLVEAVTPDGARDDARRAAGDQPRLDEADRLRHRQVERSTVRGRPRSPTLHARGPGEPTRRRLARSRLERETARPRRGSRRVRTSAQRRSARRRRRTSAIASSPSPPTSPPSGGTRRRPIANANACSPCSSRTSP